MLFELNQLKTPLPEHITVSWHGKYLVVVLVKFTSSDDRLSKGYEEQISC
jgi:hypothetical protein